MKAQLLLLSFLLAFNLQLQCTQSVAPKVSRNMNAQARRKPSTGPGVRPPMVGTEKMAIQGANKGRRADIPPRKEKRPVAKAKEGNPKEFEMMRLKKAREQAKKQSRKEREPLKEIVITDESYFDIQIADFYGRGQHRTERISIGCFGLLTPVTCLNFVSLTRGFRKGKDKLQYKGSTVKKIITDFMIQMGEVRSKTDRDSEMDLGVIFDKNLNFEEHRYYICIHRTDRVLGQSIFGRVFPDESFAVSHNHAGWVGMANYGRDTNGSQFYILLRPSRWLDGKYVIFGKVTQGMEFIRALGEEKTNNLNFPVRNITIIDSGSVAMRNHIRLSADHFNTDGDLRPFPN